VTLDDALRPSPEAEPILRRAGWSPGRAVDASKWVEVLQQDGNHVFSFAEAIMRNFPSVFRSQPSVQAR
jgi:hypothetical protein